MSWHCLRDVVADFSAADSRVSLPSVPWSGSPSPEKCCSDASGTVCFPCSRSGTTPTPLTAPLGVGLFMSSLRVSPASRSASPASSSEKKIPATAGPPPQEYLAKYDPTSRSWRTSQVSLLTDTLDEYLETWPNSAWMRSGTVYPQRQWAPRTDDTDSGYWPTPTAAEGSKIPAQANYGQVGLNNHPRIRGSPTREKLVKSGGKQTRRTYPTPTAGEGLDRGTNWDSLRRLDKGGRIARRMATLEMPETKTTPAALLNPMWVEWLMGWPLGWTDLRPLGMDRFRQWLRLHGTFSPDARG